MPVVLPALQLFPIGADINPVRTHGHCLHLDPPTHRRDHSSLCHRLRENFRFAPVTTTQFCDFYYFISTNAFHMSCTQGCVERWMEIQKTISCPLTAPFTLWIPRPQKDGQPSHPMDSGSRGSEQNLNISFTQTNCSPQLKLIVAIRFQSGECSGESTGRLFHGTRRLVIHRSAETAPRVRLCAERTRKLASCQLFRDSKTSLPPQVLVSCSAGSLFRHQKGTEMRLCFLDLDGQILSCRRRQD